MTVESEGAATIKRCGPEMARRGDGLRLRDGQVEAAAGNGATAELRRLIAGAALVTKDGQPAVLKHLKRLSTCGPKTRR
jgi:hypothetical protein